VNFILPAINFIAGMICGSSIVIVFVGYKYSKECTNSINDANKDYLSDKVNIVACVISILSFTVICACVAISSIQPGISGC